MHARLPALLLAAVIVTPASAETLREALVKAYETNPRLGGGRANLTAAQASIAEARSLRAFTADSDITLGQTFDPLATFDNQGRTVNVQANASLPLFRGGLITSSIGAARNRRDAAALDLVALENNVFQTATTAYEDVRRDREVVELNRSNVRVLSEQLRQSRDRFEVGDLTRTDVAQSEARLARAEADLRQAQAQLVASEQAYIRVVGEPPQALEPPPPLGALPISTDQALDLARGENPRLLAAQASAEANRFDIGVARAERRPSVFGTVNGRYQNFLGTAADAFGVPNGVGVQNDFTTSTAGVTLRLPLNTGGAVRARIDQARARESQARFNILQVDREVTEDARNSYEGLIASRSVIQSAEAQVRANEIALEGVRAENSVGLRTVLDVLDAEQELLNARVELARARRNEYVAGFALLASIGRASADRLDLTGEATLADPTLDGARAPAL